ncbi:MAG: hypothetical protein LBF22_00255, partial [Deltaproteobacteria bacterium]|nr:hypothetical protein [Deltaproteobacteria bacterium]
SLNSEIKDDIRFGRMTSGHGRAILSIKNKEKWPEARGIVLSRSLTVRQTEALAKKLNKGVKLSRSEGDGEKAYYESLEKGFTDALNGLKTKIHYKGKKKKIEITYHTNEEIENIMKKLGIENL